MQTLLSPLQTVPHLDSPHTRLLRPSPWDSRLQKGTYKGMHVIYFSHSTWQLSHGCSLRNLILFLMSWRPCLLSDAQRPCYTGLSYPLSLTSGLWPGLPPPPSPSRATSSITGGPDRADAVLHSLLTVTALTEACRSPFRSLFSAESHLDHEPSSAHSLPTMETKVNKKQEPAPVVTTQPHGDGSDF